MKNGLTPHFSTTCFQQLLYTVFKLYVSIENINITNIQRYSGHFGHKLNALNVNVMFLCECFDK